jgi:hypothetical protein
LLISGSFGSALDAVEEIERLQPDISLSAPIVAERLKERRASRKGAPSQGSRRIVGSDSGGDQSLIEGLDAAHDEAAQPPDNVARLGGAEVQ